MGNLQQCSLVLDNVFGIYIRHCRSRRFPKTTIDFYQRRIPRHIVCLLNSKSPNFIRSRRITLGAYLVEMQGDDDGPDNALSAHYI